VIGRVHQKLEGHFERLCNLDLIRVHGEAGPDKSHDRCHRVPGDRQVVVEVAADLYKARIQSDLLERLALRRCRRIGIALFNSATGKTDLPGVVLEGLSALRQQDRKSVRPLDDRNQDRRRREAPATEQTQDRGKVPGGVERHDGMGIIGRRSILKFILNKCSQDIVP